MGMASYEPSWDGGDDAGKVTKGSIAYIQKNGKNDAKHLLDVLEALLPLTIKLRSLAAKGQVFNFDGYEKCRKTVETLTWHFDSIEAFTAVIGSTSWNWENPELLSLLKDVMAIDPNEIRRSVKESNIAIIEFSSDTYKRIYG
ncbi:hypothetical protein [Zavarzinia sp.]|uniref:hypothetical protein n=1 Tax=Zavarzinia sp. TaxID=2027920 RepID=UPI003BB760DA